jgi:hypothetical protein
LWLDNIREKKHSRNCQPGRWATKVILMDQKYDDWEQDSPRWRDKLDRSLREQTGNDVVTHYKPVALAFPSREPIALTFDYPQIDDRALREWVAERGWQVRIAPESTSGKNPGPPPIRFTRISPNKSSEATQAQR